ncbi:protein PFC0760c isoform X2 [Lucilia cuprina]|uniref:protein PFC0760c isoform X2 n=1 Tax=Lucilia cuprina TaxID=7375 RepID=UPI001F05F9B7|nr:protein PFC0760c isoform X2 [Lucilia cuprina]
MSTITKPRVPDGLRELMKDLTREILKEKPTDIYDFAENYFQSRLPEKENYAVKSFEESSGKYDFSYIQNPQRYQIPVALVYSIIPEGLTNLIKDLIKAILREQPSNLCDFAVEYFRHIKAATCKESLDGTKEINYSAYEKYFMNKERFLFTPYVKCTCGRTLGEAYSNNSQIENLIAIHKIQNYNTTLLSKSLVADDSNNNNNVNKITENDTISYEKYMNSIYIIQRCLRRYLKEKRGTTNTNQVSPNHNTFDHHSVTAEPMITKQYKQTSLIPTVPQLQLNQNESENISEDASYTSASTAVLSASESGRETSEPSMYENIVTKTIMEDVEMENDEKNISSQSTRDHVKDDTSTNNNEEKSTNNVNDGEGTRDINAAKSLDTQNAEFDSMEIDTMKNRNESGEINEQPVEDIDIKDFGKLQKTSVDIHDANFESHNNDLKKEKSFSGHKIRAENKITEVGSKSKLTKDAYESIEADDKKFRKKIDQTDLIDSTGNNNLETVEKYQILEKVKIRKEEQSQNLDKQKDNINIKSKLLEAISQNEIDKVPIRNPSDVFNDYNSHATTESNTNDKEKFKEIKNETVSDKAEFLENIKESNKADKIEEKLSIDSDNNVKKDDADDSVTKNLADFKESTNITDEITTQLNTNDSANLKHEIDIILGETKKGDLENNIKVTEIITDKDNGYSHIIVDNEMDLKHDKQFDDAIKLNEIDNKSVLIQQKNNDEGKTTESTKNYDEIELKNEKVEKDGTTKTHKIDEITTDSEFDKTVNNKDKSGDADSNNNETSRATAEYELNKNSELSNQTSSQEKNNTDTNIAVREKSPNTSSHTNETEKKLIEKFEIISDIDNSYSNIILNNEMDLKLDKKFNEAMQLNELDNKSVLIQQKINDENEEGGTIITSKIDEITIEYEFDKSVNKNNKSGDSGLNNQETLRATAEYELNKKSELNDQTSPQETNNTDTNITLREKSPTKLSDLNEIDMNFVEKSVIISDKDNSSSHIMLNLKHDNKSNDTMEQNKKSVLIQPQNNGDGKTFPSTKDNEIKLDNEEFEIDGKTIINKTDVNNENKSGDVASYNQQTTRGSAENEFNINLDLTDQNSLQKENNSDTHIAVREMSAMKFRDTNETDKNLIEKSNKNLSDMLEKEIDLTHGNKFEIKYDIKKNLNKSSEQMGKKLIDGNKFDVEPQENNIEESERNELVNSTNKNISVDTDEKVRSENDDMVIYRRENTQQKFKLQDSSTQNLMNYDKNFKTNSQKSIIDELKATTIKNELDTDVNDVFKSKLDEIMNNSDKIKDANVNMNESNRTSHASGDISDVKDKITDKNNQGNIKEDITLVEKNKNTDDLKFDEEFIQTESKTKSVSNELNEKLENYKSFNKAVTSDLGKSDKHKVNNTIESSIQENNDGNVSTNVQESTPVDLNEKTNESLKMNIEKESDNNVNKEINNRGYDKNLEGSIKMDLDNNATSIYENISLTSEQLSQKQQSKSNTETNAAIEPTNQKEIKIIQTENIQTVLEYSRKDNDIKTTDDQEPIHIDLNEKGNECLNSLPVLDTEHDQGGRYLKDNKNTTSVDENINLSSEYLTQKRQSESNLKNNSIEPKKFQEENIQTEVGSHRNDNDFKGEECVTKTVQGPTRVDLNDNTNESLNNEGVKNLKGSIKIVSDNNTTSMDEKINLTSENVTQEQQSESNLINTVCKPTNQNEIMLIQTEKYLTTDDQIDIHTTSMDKSMNLTSKNLTQKRQSESNLTNAAIEPKIIRNENIPTDVESSRNDKDIKTEEYVTRDDKEDKHTTSMDENINLTSENLTPKHQSESNLANTATELKIIPNENIQTDVEFSRNDKDIKTEEYVTRDDQGDKHTTPMDESINLTSENLTPKHQSESTLANTATKLKIIPNENIQTDVEFSRNDKDIKTEEYVTRDNPEDKHTTSMNENINLTSENLTQKHQSESNLTNTATEPKIIQNENIQKDVESSRNDKDIKTEEYVTSDDQEDKHTTSMDENIHLTSENLTPKHQSEYNLTNTATERMIIQNENIQTDVGYTRNYKDFKTEEYVTRDDQGDKHTTSMDESINLTSKNLTPKHQSESNLTNTATEPKIIPNENIKTDVESSRNDKDIKTEEYVTRDDQGDKHTTSMDENINLTSENLTPKHQSESKLTNTATELKIIPNENIQTDVEFSRNDKDIKTEEYVTRDDQGDKHTTPMDESINLTSENVTTKHQSESNLTNTATDSKTIPNEYIQTDVESSRNDKDIKTEEYVTRDDQGDKHTTSMDEYINLTSENLTQKHQYESNLTDTATEPNIIQNENIQMDVEYSKNNKDIKTEEYVTRDNPEDKHTTSMNENINLTSENLTQKHQSESNLTNTATEPKIIQNENIQKDVESSRNDKDIKTEEYVTRDDPEDKHTTSMDENINLTSENLTQKHQYECNLTNIATELKIIPNENIQMDVEYSKNNKDIKTEEYVTRDNPEDKHTTSMNETPKHQSESNLTNTATELKIIQNENIQKDVESSRNDKDIKTEEYVTRGDQGDKHTTSMDESINLTSENLTQKHQYESNLTETATEPNIIQNENIQMDVESIRNDKDIKTEEYVTRDDQEDKHTASMDENINLTSENLTPKHQSESNLTNTATELKLISNENIQMDVESSRSDKDIKSEECVTRDDQEGKHTTSMDESIKLTSETLSQKCQSNFTNTASEPKIIKKESIQIEVESRRNNTDVTTEENQAQNLHNINQLKASQSETNYSENIDDLAIQNADYNLDEKLYETENEIATSGTSNVPKEISPIKLENKKDNKFESDLQIDNTLNKTENSTPINNSNLLNEPSQPISDESCNETCVEIINKKSETGDFVSTTNANKQNNISSEMTKIDSFDANSINISNNNDETTNNEDYPIHDSNMTDELIDKTFTLKSSRAINVEHVNKNIVETLQTDSENSKTNVNVDDTISDTNITDEIITKNCVKESQAEKHTEGKEITYRDDITSSKISSKQLEVSSEKSTNILKKAIKDAMESSENENHIKGETVIRETNEQGDHITTENQEFLSTSKNSQNKYLYESHDHQAEDQTEHIMEKRDAKQLEIGPDASTKEDYDTKAIPLSVENERNQSSELQSGISKHEKSAVNKIDSDNYDQKEKHVDERCNYEELANKIISGEDQELSVKNKTKPLEKLLEDLDVATSDSIKANDDNIETTNSDTAGIVTNVGINDNIMQLKNDFKKSSSHKIVKQETQIKQIQESQENESENESNYSSLVQVDNQNLKDLNDINEDNRDNQKEVSKQNIVINMDDSNSKLIVEKSINKENDVQKAISNNENIHGDKEISKISLKSKKIETHDDKDFNSQSRNKREAENYPKSEHKYNNELDDTKKDITVHDDDVLGLRDKNVIGENVHLNEDNNSLGSNMNKLQSSVSDTRVSSLDVQQQPTHEKNYTSKNETNAKNLASPSFPIQKKSTETNKLKDNQPNEIKKENFNSSTVQNTEKTETTINESSNIEQNISRTSKDDTLDGTSKYDSKDKLLETDDTQEHRNESNNKNVAKTSNINSSIDQTYHCNQQVSNINQNESVHHYKSDRGTQADADDKKPQMSSQDNIKQENTEQRLTDVTAETTNDEETTQNIGIQTTETFIGNQNLTIGRIRNFNEGLLGSISGQRFAETHLRSFWKEYVMNNSMPLSQYDYKENEPKIQPEPGTSQQQNVNQVNETNLSAYKNEEKPIDIIEPEIIKETIKHSESSPVMNHSISTANNDSTPSKDIERIPRYFYGVPDTEPNYSSSCSKRKSYKEPTAFTIAIGDLNKKQNTKIAKSPKSNKDVECLKSDIKLNLNKLDLSEKEYAEPLLESETPPKVFQDLNEFEYEIHDIDRDITYTIDEIIRLKIENDSQNNSDDKDANGTSEYSLTPEPMLQTIVELSESETPKPPDQLHSIDDDFLANLERISDTTSTSWTTGSKEDNSFISDEFLDEKNQNEYIKQGHTTSDSEHKTQGGIYEFSKDNMAGKELKSQDYEEIIAQAPTPPNDDPFYGDLKETAAKTIQEAYRQFKQKKLLKPVENISKLKAETESSNKRSNREMLNNKKDEHLTSKGNSTKFNVEKNSNLIYPKENNVKATNSEQEFKIPVNLTSHDGINNFECKKLEKYVINETILNPTDSESYNKNNIKKIFKNTENYEDFKTMSEIDYSNTKSSGNNFNFESKQASIGQEIKTEEKHNVTIKFSVEKLKEEICNEVATSTVRESSNNIKFTNFNKDDKNNANASIEGLNSEVFASHLNTESSNNTKDTNIDITTTDLKFDEYDKSQNLGRNEISTENLESPNSNNIRDSYKETAINEYDINDVNSNELANQTMKIDQKSSVDKHIKEFSSKNTNIESSNNIKDTNINVTNTDPTISENNESQNHGGNEYVEIINVTSTENFKGTPYIEMATSSTKNIIVANQPIETNIESLADKLKEKFNTEMASSIVLKETSNIIKDVNIDISNKDFKFGLNEKSDINSNDFTNQTNDKTIHDDLPSDHIYFKPTAPAEEDIHSIVSIDSLQSNEILHDQAARKIQKAFKNFIERKFKLSSNLGTFKESLKSNWFVGNEPIIAKKSLPKTKSEISFEETEAYVELTTNPPQYLVDSSSNLEAIDANNFSRSPTAPVTNRSRNSVDLANYQSTNISKDTVSVIGIDAGAIENANTEHSQVNTNNSTNMIPSKDKIEENQAIKYPTLIDQFLNSERHYSEAVNHHNKEIIFTSPDFTEITKILSNSAGSQKQQYDSVIQYERLEEPCIKKSTSITHIIGDDAKNAEIISDTAINTDNSSSSDIDDTEDSLSTKTVKLHKPDEAITKMQQRRDSTTKILNLDKPKDYNFDEPLVVSIDNLDTDEEGIVVNKLQREETRESSAQSDFDVIIGGNKDENFTFLDSIDIEESFPSKGSLKRVHTIAGDGDSKSLLKNVTIDESIKYIEPPDYELNSGSLCLDNETAENIRRKMMAYSFSEADSDCFDKSPSTNDGTNSESKSQKYDDFNVSTALVENIDSSTETESTIVSAVTKIQAGARGYLTRKRLGKASMASDGKSMPHDDMNKASFGNAAISESLEYLVQEAAAKRIQRVYRQHYRKKLAEVKQKEDHSFSPEFTTSLESTLAQKRSIMLQRGDALRNDSTPDEGNSSSNGSGSENAKIEDISKNKNLSGNDESNNFDMQHLKKNTSGNYSLKATSTAKTAATIRAKKIEENKIRWLAMRQNSMPVQIDSEVLRVIPKYMRKKIKSADGGKKKDRRQVLMD